jgi:hypothetical protein
VKCPAGSAAENAHFEAMPAERLGHRDPDADEVLKARAFR